MTSRQLLLAVLFGLTGLSVQADDQRKAVPDDEVGKATRNLLKEQAEGTNRGEIEPYRAESAGKAYRAYIDSIGTAPAAPTSQLGAEQ